MHTSHRTNERTSELDRRATSMSDALSLTAMLSKARRSRSTSFDDCVKLTYIGLICWISASGVASPCPTSAPSVTSARPIRPEIGAVTVA